MIELTENEKEIFMNRHGNYDINPFDAIEEGLVDSHFITPESMEFVEAVYDYAKRVLIEMAKKRNINFNDNDSFKANEIIDSYDEFEDFKPEYFDDLDTLRNYVFSKVENKDVSEIEFFVERFAGNFGVVDSIRVFMAKYITYINNNLDQIRNEIDSLSSSNPDNVDVFNDETFDSSHIDSGDEEFSFDFDELDSLFDDVENFSVEGTKTSKPKEEISDEKLVECIKYLNSFYRLMRYKINGKNVSNELYEVLKNKKLEDFYSDSEFYENLKNMMSHDKKKSVYLFHGTQDLESAENIIHEGFGMIKHELSSSTYPEFSIDNVLLYSRGFGGEIGKDAIVIIDQPKDNEGRPIDIVEKITKKIHFSPSGLQGLNQGPNYIVDPKYVVGYVNKLDKKVVYNPLYYRYNELVFNYDDVDTQQEDIHGYHS